MKTNQFTLDILSNYSPSFASSGVANEDADAVLERIISVPCGTDAVTYSEKSNNTTAKSFAGAGRSIVSAIANEENKRRKIAAFTLKHPRTAHLVGFDDEVNELFKEFKEYTRTSDVAETRAILNCEKGIPLEVRNQAAKQVAVIGSYTGLLTDDVAEKFAKACFNYFIQKNPMFHAAVLVGVDTPTESESTDNEA